MENIEQLERQAVDEAIRSDWKTAVEINKIIVSLDKKNLSAYLRLGFAYIQMEKYEDSKRFYKKALKIQPNSNVAKENLDRIKVLQNKGSKKNKKSQISLDPNLFLDVPGKTKSVVLVNLGQKSTLAHLSIGQEVYLKPKKRKVEIRTKDNEYTGNLPDDLSRRLQVFLKAKSIYKIFIKEANLSKVTIFINEEKKGKRVQHYLSFPQNMQLNISEMVSTSEKENDEDADEVVGVDLEKIAESLASEEKDYLPFHPENEEEESEE